MLVYEIIIKIGERNFVIIPVKDFKDLRRIIDNYEKVAKLKSVSPHGKR